MNIISKINQIKSEIEGKISFEENLSPCQKLVAKIQVMQINMMGIGMKQYFSALKHMC